jgi:hypothetical protein
MGQVIKMMKEENTLTQQSRGVKYIDHRNVPYTAAIPKLSAANISKYYFFLQFMCIILSSGY